MHFPESPTNPEGNVVWRQAAGVAAVMLTMIGAYETGKPPAQPPEAFRVQADGDVWETSPRHKPLGSFHNAAAIDTMKNQQTRALLDRGIQSDPESPDQRSQYSDIVFEYTSVALPGACTANISHPAGDIVIDDISADTCAFVFNAVTGELGIVPPRS